MHILGRGSNSNGMHDSPSRSPLRHKYVPTLAIISYYYYFFYSYNVEISGGLGSLAGKIWRVGLMGNNATIENVDLVLKIIKEGLNLHQKAIQSSL